MNGLDKENTYVLLIGASKYPYWRVMDIPNVHVNLREVVSLLSDPFYWGIPTEKIKVIEDENIEDTNNGIQEFFDNITTPRATVILYYSGHGLQSVKAVDDLFLATLNIKEKTFEASSIKISELRRLFSECIAARKILLLDCCYAGKITKGFMSDDNSESIAKLNDFEGTYIMAASSEYERAKFDPEDPNSPTKFTGKLLEVIKNGIESDDEFCTLNSIYNQIRSSFLTQKDAPKPVQIGQNNIGNLPIFKNKKFVERIPKDEQVWNKAIALNSIYAYNSFIDQFPESKYKKEAETRIQYLEDDEAWEKCCDKNTIWGYRNYLNNYNNHTEEAKKKLRDLSLIGQEKVLWQSAVSENKIEAFKNYCDTYPNGIYIDEAIQHIKELNEKDAALILKKSEEKVKDEERQKQEEFKEKQFWKQVNTDDTINSYQQYIIDYPNGKYKDEAKEKLDKLKILNEEEIYWENVNKDSISSLNIYLENYPKGKHYKEASNNINQLTEKQNKKLKLKVEQEGISWWKNSKKWFIVIGLEALFIIFLIWFLKAYSDSVYGKEITVGAKDASGISTKARLNYTNKISPVEAERVVTFMSMHGIGDNAGSIGHQLDIYNDTILFKYSLFSKDEVTPTVKSSMQEFGKLLADSLFNNRLLKVMACNIGDKIEYLSYAFGINNPKKKDSAKNIISSKQNDIKSIKSDNKNDNANKSKIDISGGYSDDSEEDTIKIAPIVEQKSVEPNSNLPIKNKNETEVKKNIIILKSNEPFIGDLYIDNKYFDRLNFTQKDAVKKIELTQGSHVFMTRNVSSLSSTKLIKESGLQFDINVSKDLTITFKVDRKVWDANGERWGKGITMTY